MLGQEEHAEQRCEGRFEREDERRARRGRAGLHPGRDEVSERAREDAGHDERVPGLGVVRGLDLSRGDRDGREPDERDRHLQERECPCVVARRKPLHRDDLQRLGDRVREHEHVPEPRPSGGAAQQQQTGHRQQDSDPDRRRNGGSERGERKERREDDVETGDEPVLVTVVSSRPAVWSP